MDARPDPAKPVAKGATLPVRTAVRRLPAWIRNNQALPKSSMSKVKPLELIYLHQDICFSLLNIIIFSAF